MNKANGGAGVEGWAVDIGGNSGQANKCVTKRAHMFASSI